MLCIVTLSISEPVCRLAFFVGVLLGTCTAKCAWLTQCIMCRKHRLLLALLLLPPRKAWIFASKIMLPLTFCNSSLNWYQIWNDSWQKTKEKKIQKYLSVSLPKSGRVVLVTRNITWPFYVAPKRARNSNPVRNRVFENCSDTVYTLGVLVTVVNRSDKNYF